MIPYNCTGPPCALWHISKTGQTGILSISWSLHFSIYSVSLQHVRITRGSEVNKCLFIPLSALKVCISCSSCWRIIFTVYIDSEVYFHRHVSLNYEKLFFKNYWDSQVLPVKRKFDWANFIHTVSLCGRPRWTFFAFFFFIWWLSC